MMYTNQNFNELLKLVNLSKNSDLKNLINKIKKSYDDFNTKSYKYTDKYNNTVKDIFDTLPIKIQTGISGEKNVFIDNHFEGDILKVFEALKMYYNKFTSIKYLEFLGEENRNVVLVGPNGSGKTTLLRKLNNDTHGAKIGYFQADRVLLISKHFQPKRDYESFIQELNENFYYSSNIDNDSQGSYIQRQFDFYISLLEKERNEENEKKIIDGITQRIINFWNDLVKDRELFFEYGLRVKTSSSIIYDIKYLSSGEKAILFFLIGTLLREQQDYYFIDEPENNLNPAIVSRLWSFIEKERRNSIFVYLTHNAEFVASRINAKIYWIKKYEGNNEWEWEDLPENKELPQELVISLVGNRQPVLFCESEDENKMDTLIFKLMFPQFKVVSAKGCDKVISQVKAYKELGLPQKAFGIIDCDYKSDEFLNAQMQKNIFHLPFFEIENFLVSKQIIQEMIEKFCTCDKIQAKCIVEDVIRKLFIERKDILALRKTAFDLRDTLGYNGKIKSISTFIEFKEIYKNIQKDDDEIDKIYNYNKNFYEEIIKENNQDIFLRYLDYKGEIIKRINEAGIFNNKFDYEREVLSFLNSEDGTFILETARAKFLSQIQ